MGHQTCLDDLAVVFVSFGPESIPVPEVEYYLSIPFSVPDKMVYNGDNLDLFSSHFVTDNHARVLHTSTVLRSMRTFFM